jgi:hypothetical protein
MSNQNQETLSSLRARKDKETANTINAVFLNLNPDFQRDYEAWDEKMTTRLIESILLGRAMNPLWIVVNTEENTSEEIPYTEEILDGKHRLTTLINFIDNKIPIGKSMQSLNVEQYSGKKFKDLNKDDQQKIRNYNFSINRLDSSYREDMDKLQDMYEILNKSSKPLNIYELNKPTYSDLYSLITSQLNKFENSVLYNKKNKKRGQGEMEIMKLLAISWSKTLPKFSSLNDNMNKWQVEIFGEKKDEVKQNVENEELRKEIIDKIDRLTKMAKKFRENNVFINDDEKEEYKYDDMVVRCYIARLIANTKPNSIRDPIFTKICEQAKNLFKLDSEGLASKIGNTGRGLQFQRKLIEYIDKQLVDILDDTIMNERRLFTSDEIQRKRADQQNLCALCKQLMSDQQPIEGDHIQSYASGGRTDYSNLQVVHRTCHQRKADFQS